MTTLKSKQSLSRSKARRFVKSIPKYSHLPSSQMVHHVDQDVFNNDPNNLIIMLGGEHTSLHWILNPERRGGRLKSIEYRLKELEQALILYNFDH